MTDQDARPAASWFSLEGRRAIVTGAGQGIGRGIALAFADAGAQVVVVERPGHPEVSSVVQALGERGAGGALYEQDLAVTTELAALVDRIVAEQGVPDVLVNNAAVSGLRRFNEISVEEWRRLMAVNVDAPFFLAQRTAEHMIRAGTRGRIINLSSKNGIVAEAGLAHYNTSKGAVELLTQSLAVELGEHGITVNALAPGIVATGMEADFPLDWDRFVPYYEEHIPLEGRAATVEECAQVAVFLASDAAAYVTGQHVVMDGGVLAGQVPRLPFMPPYRSSLPAQGTTPTD